jgi:hypothetical protein
MTPAVVDGDAPARSACGCAIGVAPRRCPEEYGVGGGGGGGSRRLRACGMADSTGISAGVLWLHSGGISPELVVTGRGYAGHGRRMAELARGGGSLGPDLGHCGPDLG